MNFDHQRQQETSEDQAALWAARLDGSSLEEADRSALEAWLGENQIHRELLAKYSQLSADLDVQLPALVAAGGVVMPPEKTPARRRLSIPWIATAALAAAAGVVIAIRLGNPAARFDTVATAAGHRQSCTLADGTHVELNARTRIEVGTGRAERRVRLIEGEAFFIVSKDKTRPFIVETPAGSVRVTGTMFDVRSDVASELDVTVVEGKVQVLPVYKGDAQTGASVALGADDSLSARAGVTSVQTLSSAAVDDALAWRQGKIVFNGVHGVPLRDALGAFSRYHDRAIIVSSAAADLRIGGRFSLDDFDGFFTTLQEALPVRVTRGLNNSVRVSLRNEP